MPRSTPSEVAEPGAARQATTSGLVSDQDVQQLRVFASLDSGFDPADKHDRGRQTGRVDRAARPELPGSPTIREETRTNNETLYGWLISSGCLCAGAGRSHEQAGRGSPRLLSASHP